MAIATYSELQTAVQNWLDNTNTLPAARVQEFIALAEADFNRRIRCRENLAVATGTLSEATLALPADFAGLESLTVTANGYEQQLDQFAGSSALEAYGGWGTGQPRALAVEGSNVRVWPTPDAAYTYTLRYYQRVPALSSEAGTNWLLTKHPDVYLFGALVQAELFLVDDPRVALWSAKYEMALGQVLVEAHLASVGSRSYHYREIGTP